MRLSVLTASTTEMFSLTVVSGAAGLPPEQADVANSTNTKLDVFRVLMIDVPVQNST